MLSNDTCRCCGKDCPDRETCARYRFRAYSSGPMDYVSVSHSLRQPGAASCDMHMEIYPDELEQLKKLDEEAAKEPKKWMCD